LSETKSCGTKCYMCGVYQHDVLDRGLYDSLKKVNALLFSTSGVE